MEKISRERNEEEQLDMHRGDGCNKNKHELRDPGDSLCADQPTKTK